MQQPASESRYFVKPNCAYRTDDFPSVSVRMRRRGISVRSGAKQPNHIRDRNAYAR